MSIVFKTENFLSNGFASAVPSENSRKSYRNHLSHFEQYLSLKGKTPLNESVTNEDIDEYFNLLKKSYSLNTIAGKSSAIRSYFKWAKKVGAITHSPLVKPQAPDKAVKRVVVTDLDISSVLASIVTNDDLQHTRDAAMFALMAYAKIKTEQITGLQVGDLRLEKGVVVVNKKAYPLGQARTFVVRYEEQKKQTARLVGTVIQNADDPVFLNKYGKRISGRSFRRHLTKYLNSLGLKNIFSTRDLTYIGREQVRKEELRQKGEAYLVANSPT